MTATTTTRTYRGRTITRKVVGHAYPRNGNVHNPTPRILWIVDDGVTSRTLKAAKSYIDDLIGDTP